MTLFCEPDKLPSCHRQSGALSLVSSAACSHHAVDGVCASSVTQHHKIHGFRRRTVLNHFRPYRCSRGSCMLVRHACRQRFGSTVTSTSLVELTAPFSLLSERVLVDLTSLRSFIVSWQWRRALLLKSNFHRVRPASVFMEQPQRLRRL